MREKLKNNGLEGCRFTKHRVLLIVFRRAKVVEFVGFESDYDDDYDDNM